MQDWKKKVFFAVLQGDYDVLIAFGHVGEKKKHLKLQNRYNFQIITISCGVLN